MITLPVCHINMTTRRVSTYMKKAKVEKTPQVWKAWFIWSCEGYMTAASIMIHQPVKNWDQRTGVSPPSQQEVAPRTGRITGTHQNPGSHRRHGVPPLPPVHALALRPAEVVQEPSHHSQCTSDLNQSRSRSASQSSSSGPPATEPTS